MIDTLSGVKVDVTIDVVSSVDKLTGVNADVVVTVMTTLDFDIAAP